jgi:hypothetical protein
MDFCKLACMDEEQLMEIPKKLKRLGELHLARGKVSFEIEELEEWFFDIGIDLSETIKAARGSAP